VSRWSLVASTTSDTTGNYSFTGLRPGFYIVQVADGTPDADLIGGVTTTTLPPGAQTAEAANDQVANSGISCGSCDGVWGVTSGVSGQLDTTSFNPLDTSNESITNVDFGYNTGAMLFGSVWHDHNGDGSRAATDGGFGGVTVTLTNCGADNNCTTTGDNSSATDSSDLNGNYAFSNLTAGRQYQLTVSPATLPGGATGWVGTAESDSSIDNQIRPSLIVAGSSTGPHSFGFNRGGSFALSGSLYYDWNGNGTKDSGDEGISNVDMFLYSDEDGDGLIDSNSDNLLATVVTAAGGAYSFNNRDAGAYIIMVHTDDPDLPTYVSQSGDPDESGTCSVCDRRGSRTVSSASITGIDFGYLPFGSQHVGDLVWHDRDGDGVQSGLQERGLASVTVSLLVDQDGDGTFVTARTASTDSDGNYRFEHLPNGTYQVVVDTSDADLPNDAFGNNYAPTADTSYTITLTGSDDLSADFGFAALGAMGNSVFWDSNGDGEQDWDEVGIPGVVVSLYRDLNQDGLYTAGTDTLVGTDTTDADGWYLFSGLEPRKYVVVVGSVSGSPTLTADPEADGLPCTTTGITGCDDQSGQTIYPGSSVMGVDFGYQPPAVVGDSLWIDADSDGVRDPNEAGIPFVGIELVSSSCTQGSTCPHVETDSDGYYSFKNVADGSYTVVVDTTDTDFPSGLTQVADPDSSLNGQSAVVVTGGAVTSVGGTACTNCGLNVDFGYRYSGPNNLSGTICLESATINGVCGAGSSGIAPGEVAFNRVMVFLLRWSDDGDSQVEAGETILIANTSSDGNGDYAFQNIPAGSYAVAIAAPDTSLALTTQSGDTPASQVVPTPASGDVTGVYRS
jgi:protocatechuate 3,4-dioxygenase beta subunit